jgi:tetratricopeptide (TPR) repeat protein
MRTWNCIIACLACAACAATAAHATTPKLTSHLDYLCKHGRWEQVIETVDRAGAGDPDLTPYKERASRELPNLYRFLRVRNAYKRGDNGTAILIARDIEPSSVYRPRADDLVKKATKRYGAAETKRAAASTDRSASRVQLALVLDLRPGYAPAEAALAALDDTRAVSPAPEAEIPKVAPPTPATQEKPKEKVKEKPNEEPDERPDPTEVPVRTEVVSVDELASPPAPSAAVAGLVRDARSAADKRDYSRAAELLGSAIETDPGFAPAHHYLGAVHRARGDQAAAVAAFETFLRLAPGDPKAAQTLAYVRDHTKVISGEPNARECMDEAGKAAADGNLEGAIGWLERATETDEKLPEAWLQLGIILERVERKAPARQAYENYLSLAPDGPFALNAQAGVDRLK